MGFRFQGFYHLFGGGNYGGALLGEEVLYFGVYLVSYCDQSKKKPTPQQTRGTYVHRLIMSRNLKPSSITLLYRFSRK